ncbi:MAG: DUF2807 domain-containing protein [Bacteroidia bacterium]|nr:DUF2807 domain-containing protein [Bacteroidia bacterium]
MKKLTFLLLLVGMVAILYSCFLDCIVGSGKPVTELRKTGKFNSVKFNGSGNLHIRKGPVEELSITADDNLMPYLETKISGNTLVISEKKCFDKPKQLDYQLSLPEMKSLILNGSGNIDATDTFRLDKFEIELNGSGNIMMNIIADKVSSQLSGSGEIALSGRTGKHDVELSGSGELNCFNLRTLDSEIDLSGSGVCRVEADMTLNVSLSGSGDVIYKGNPKSRKTNITGSGEVTQAE